MALSFSQSSQHVRLSMPLAKFSYANTPAGNPGPIPWIHLSSHNDLFVVLDPYEVSTEVSNRERRYKFKVLQDPGVHEDFDLYMLACEAQRAIDEVQKSEMPSQQPSITIIVKVPCIAMRYPLQDRQVRRFQVRYVKEEDFYETLKIFASMRIPFIEAGVVQPAQTTLPAPNTYTLPRTAATHPSEIRKDCESNNARAVQPNHNLAYQEPVCKMPSVNDASTAHSHQGWASPSLNVPFSVSQPNFMSPNRLRQIEPPVSTLSFQPKSITNTLAATDIRTEIYNLDHPLSTYVPRPSTAPVPTKQASDISLPPKRDLPFERKKEHCDPQVSTHPANGGPVTRQQTARVASNGNKPAEISESEDASPGLGVPETKPGTKGVKKKPAPRKTRAASTRKKCAVKKTQAEAPVPTVEELLQRNSATGNDVSSAWSQIDAHSSYDKDIANLTAKNGTKETQHANTMARTQDQHESSTNQYHTTHTRSQAQPQHSALAALLSNPDFASPPSNLSNPAATADFDSLPEDQRREALETWIVQTLGDDGFVRLCQTLEGMWQRIFVRF